MGQEKGIVAFDYVGVLTELSLNWPQIDQDIRAVGLEPAVITGFSPDNFSKTGALIRDLGLGVGDDDTYCGYGPLATEVSPADEPSVKYQENGPKINALKAIINTGGRVVAFVDDEEINLHGVADLGIAPVLFGSGSAGSSGVIAVANWKDILNVITSRV